MKRLRGFTLVELIVVIAIIGILASIAVIGFSRYQTDTRDARRASSANVIAEGLEKYYAANGEYPGCSQLTQPSDTVTGNTGVLSGLDAGTLRAPQAPSGTTNSIYCGDVTSINGTDQFGYVGDGSATCNAGTSCLQFTLKYFDETNNTVASIDSRHRTNAATSGSTTISASGTTYTRTNLNWAAVPNAASYRIEYSTNNFVSTNSATATSAPYQLTGLANGTTYSVRLVPVTSTGDGSLSNTISVTTQTFSAPVLAVAPYSDTRVTASWPAVTGATSYTLVRATNTGFTANVVTTPNVTSPYSVTGLDGNITYYFRIQAVNSELNSAWSNTVTIKPSIPTPTGPSIAAAMSGTNAVGTAGIISCPDGTTAEYSLRSSSTITASPGAWSAWSTFSPSVRTLTVATAQGYRYTFEAQGRCVGSILNSDNGNTGAVAHTVRQIGTLSVPQMVIDGSTAGSRYWNNGSQHTVSYNTFCPANTTTVAGTYGAGAGGYSKAAGFNWSDGVDYYRYYGQPVIWNYPSGYGSGSPILYNAYYGCQSPYASYVQSAESSDVIYIVN